MDFPCQPNMKWLWKNGLVNKRVFVCACVTIWVKAEFIYLCWVCDPIWQVMLYSCVMGFL